MSRSTLGSISTRLRLVRVKRVRRSQRDVQETHAFEIHLEIVTSAPSPDAIRAAFTPLVRPASTDDPSRQHAGHTAETARRCRPRV